MADDFVFIIKESCSDVEHGFAGYLNFYFLENGKPISFSIHSKNFVHVLQEQVNRLRKNNSCKTVLLEE